MQVKNTTNITLNSDFLEKITDKMIASKQKSSVVITNKASSDLTFCRFFWFISFNFY